MEEELLKRRNELHSEYQILLDRLKQIEQEKNASILLEKEKLEKKSKIYKTFYKRKYLIELENLKFQINLNKIYFHDFEEVKAIKRKIVEINDEIEAINDQIEQIRFPKRM